jgi:hypothetical protein
MRARLYQLLWVAPLAGLAILAGFSLWLGVRALVYPYQFLHGEGLMLEFSRRLMAGEPIYKPLAEFPLGTCNYAPLPLVLARLTFPILGFGYAAGRVWVLVATLAIAVILFAWVRRAGGQIVPALVASLVWLGAPYVYHWMPQFRVDLPGLAFSLAGVYVVWRSQSRYAVLGAALLFVLGLYCKQSFLAGPAAAILYLLVREPRRALLLAGAMLLLGGIPFLALNITTNGAFWDSLVSANVNPFKLDLLFSQVAEMIRIHWPLMLLTAAFLIPAARRRAAAADGAVGRPPQANGLIVIYIGLALLTMGLAGKVGSWENYFLEPLAALCLGAGLGLARLMAPAGSPTGRSLGPISARELARWLAPLLVLAQVIIMWHTPARAARIMRADAAANEALGPVVAAAPGTVLSEDMGLLVQAGKPVVYYDFQFSQLALAGRWDQRWEVDNLRQGTFPLVIFEGDARIEVEKYGRYTRAFMSALDYGYRQAERVGKYLVYRPAPLDRDRNVRLTGGLALVGHTLPPAEVEPGGTISLDAVWQATRSMTESYTSFLHLVDATGQGYAGDDHQAWDGLYPTTRWVEGEMVRMTYSLTLPADLPPGLYTLRAGWYDPSLTRLRTEAGTDSVPLAVVQVPSTQVQPPEMAPMEAAFASGVSLTGYQLDQSSGAVRVTLGWRLQPGQLLDSDYTVFLHLRDAAGETVAQGDGPPVGGQWPTSLWSPGVTIQDTHTITLPANLPAGTYHLVTGLYDRATGSRLPLESGSDEVTLTEIAIP